MSDTRGEDGEHPGKRLLLFPSILAAAMLALALLDVWPYGYFTLLRWVVCAVSVACAVAAWSWGRRIVLLVLAGLLAALFNPLAPVELERETWMIVDLAAAAAVLFLGFALRPRSGEAK